MDKSEMKLVADLVSQAVREAINAMPEEYDSWGYSYPIKDSRVKRVLRDNLVPKGAKSPYCVQIYPHKGEYTIIVNGGLAMAAEVVFAASNLVDRIVRFNTWEKCALSAELSEAEGNLHHLMNTIPNIVAHSAVSRWFKA